MWFSVKRKFGVKGNFVLKIHTVYSLPHEEYNKQD